MLSKAALHRLSREGAMLWKNIVRSTSTIPAKQSIDVNSGVLQPMKKSQTTEQKISRAMKVYLERAREHENFMTKQHEEFGIGKRHLANMMGWDPENITQEDIDSAIEYLLPSGLFEPRARPLMKSPELIFAKQKAAEFDDSGRPLHSLFYTGQPHFFQALHDATMKIVNLNKHEVHMYHKGIKVAPASAAADLSASTWLSKNGIERLLMERIESDQYRYLVRTLNRVANHPYSSLAHEYLMPYRQLKPLDSTLEEAPPLRHDDEGRPFIEATGLRKTARARVTVHGNGSGKILLNGHISHIDYFKELKDRIQVMFPLQFVGLLNKVDIDVTVYFMNDAYDQGLMAHRSEEELLELRRPLKLQEGKTCEAGAIRHGIALALRSFVPKEDMELMRLAGLLTRDRRRRERKKPGQEGARRKYPWRKR